MRQIEIQNAFPDSTWSLDQLANFAKNCFAEASLLGRKTAQQLWRAGRAIIVVRDQLRSARKWTEWATENGLPLSSAYEAIRIAEKFESEEDIAGLTVLEAKQIAGVVKPRVESKSKSAKKGKPESEGTVPTVQPRDEIPLGEDPEADFSTSAEAISDSPDGEATESTTPHWFDQLRDEMRDEVAAIEDTVIFLEDWATRQGHPLSGALLRALIDAELISVEFDQDQDVVRVDDPELVAALAAASAVLDPIFTRLGVTPAIAAKHLLEMIREGRGVVIP